MNAIFTAIFIAPLILVCQLNSFEDDEIVNENSMQNAVESTSIEKDILFIGSYSVDWISYSDEISGIASELTSDNYSIEYTYLKGKKVEFSDEYLEFLVEHYSKLCEYTDYDAIILSDDDALNFVMENNEIYSDVFYNIPTFFLGVNSIESAENATKIRDNVYGIIEESDYQKGLGYIDSIMPNATTLNYISDSTSTGETTGDQLYSAAVATGYFTNINRINPSLLTLKEFKKSLRDIGEDEVTFMTNFSNDVNLNYYTFDEQYDLIRENLSTPFFTDDHIFPDDNFVAGRISYDFEEAGKLIGNSIRKYFANSLDITDTDIINEQPNKIVFDCDVLADFGLNYSLLDDDAILLNDLNSFSNKFIIGFRIGSLVVSILIFVFWILIHQLSVFGKQTKSILVLNSEITKLIDRDSTTGLFRNSVFKEDIKAMISAGKAFALILANADDLGYINSYYGREKGDTILRNMCYEFANVPGFAYNTYHFGGDEAVILLPFKKVSEINAFIKKEKMISGGKVDRKFVKEHFSNTVGVSLYPQDGLNANELIDNAYAAMISGKKIGKNVAVRYSPSIYKAGKENDVKNMLNDALVNDKFELYYQPIVDIKTGEVFKYEALLRIKGERMSPAIFIPVAEDTGSIIAIGKLVLKQTIEFIAEMKREGIPKRVSINFSNRQVDDKEFSSYFVKTALALGVKMSAIDVEITESFLFDNSKARGRLLNFFKENDIALAIDDFGTGYSSVNSLFSTPIKYVKIDKSLSERMCKNKASTKSLVSFFHELDLKVIFEGIEEKKQMRVCKFCKVDYIQGYYFSKPQPKDVTLKNLGNNYLDLLK